MSNSHIYRTFLDSLSEPLHGELQSPRTQPFSTSESPPCTIPTHTKVPAQLDNDEQLMFCPLCVPDFPAVLYGSNIDLLLNHWFNIECSALMVEGRRIPMKHWPQFYAKRKDYKRNLASWGKKKGQFREWKVSFS